jgi:hypothetical protein
MSRTWASTRVFTRHTSVANTRCSAKVTGWVSIVFNIRASTRFSTGHTSSIRIAVIIRGNIRFSPNVGTRVSTRCRQ